MLIVFIIVITLIVFSVFKSGKPAKNMDIRKPQPFELKWLESAKSKIITPSLEACNDLLSQTEMFIELNYENLDTKISETVELPIEFKKDVLPGIGFVISSPKMISVAGVQQKDSYGLNHSLKIRSKSGTLLYAREDSVKAFKTAFPREPQLLEGRLANLSNQPYKEIKDVYIRLIIKIEDTDITYPTSIIKEKSFLKFDQEHWNRQDTLLGLRMMSKKGQYAEVVIKDKTFDFYTIEDINSQFIDCNDALDIESFRTFSDSIRSAFAFLSGKFYRSTAFYLTSETKDFSTIKNVYYEMEEPEFLDGFELIDFSAFKVYYEDQSEKVKEQLKKYHVFFPSEPFNKLCEEICYNSTIERVVSLILSGNENLNAVQQGAIYSVAIEAFANVVYEENKEKLQPITDKKISKELRLKFISLLNEYKDILTPEAFTIFTAKLDNINQQTNQNRLIKPFEIYGIQLTQHELDSLNHRNNFLHGRTPHEKNWETKRTAMVLHHLLGCLLLKYVGYSGYLNNLPMHLIAKDIEKGGDYLPKFEGKKLQSIEAINKLLSEGKHEEALEAIEHTTNALKAMEILTAVKNDFIRII